ncbi:nicotinamide mononucleotide transporter family protein [Flindersiella endophytica]
MSWLTWLLNAELHIGGATILWREIIGNGFGLASAIFGMRRKVLAWPVGIVGNVLLFTVFLGAVFNTPGNTNLWGQAGRQIFFLAASVYGWWRWNQSRNAHEASDGGAIAPRWASWGERIQLIVAMAVGWVAFYFVLKELGSWGPLTESWILTGSILATYGMARGWTEFWLIWIAVDAVGVPTLLQAHLYPSAILYLVYAAFVVWGFVTWVQVDRRLRAEKAAAEPSAQAVAAEGSA